MAGTLALYISSLQKGGAERVVTNLTEYFSEKGYQVLLVTTRKAEVEYEVPEAVKRIISEPTDEELYGNRIGNFYARFRKLREIWKQEKPDVILSFIGKNNMMAVLTSFGLKIPVAVSVRGEPSEEYYSRILRFVARYLFKFADGVILQTRRSMDFFPMKVRKKSVILKNPVNSDFFRERYDGEREKNIVAVGRIDANKNHELLIRAFGLIANEYCQYNLVVYGEGEKKEYLKKLVKEMGLEERIFFPGSTNKVADVIYKASVFVLPSNTEGMPNTLIEAMIMGLTVIATDCPCGGPAELIEHEKNGLLTPVGDIEKMKENLQKVLDNLQKANLMGINASKIKEVYKPEKIYEEWENYMKLLGLGRNR